MMRLERDLLEPPDKERCWNYPSGYRKGSKAEYGPAGSPDEGGTDT